MVFCFLRNASSRLLVGLVHTELQCVHSFLFARLSVSDSTHRTSVCSFHVDVEFFVRYDRVFLPTFPPVPHFLRFDLTFRTHRHTPSPAVASAPPRTFYRFPSLCSSSEISHFPACATDSCVFSFLDLSEPTARFAFPA